MKTISQSATKIVFIMLALSACAGFFIGILPVEQFMTLAVAAFTYYFTKAQTTIEAKTESGESQDSVVEILNSLKK